MRCFQKSRATSTPSPLPLCHASWQGSAAVRYRSRPGAPPVRMRSRYPRTTTAVPRTSPDHASGPSTSLKYRSAAPPGDRPAPGRYTPALWPGPSARFRHGPQSADLQLLRSAVRGSSTSPTHAPDSAGDRADVAGWSLLARSVCSVTPLLTAGGSRLFFKPCATQPGSGCRCQSPSDRHRGLRPQDPARVPSHEHRGDQPALVAPPSSADSGARCAEQAAPGYSPDFPEERRPGEKPGHRLPDRNCEAYQFAFRRSASAVYRALAAAAIIAPGRRGTRLPVPWLLPCAVQQRCSTFGLHAEFRRSQHRTS